ncbi:MAG: hypothetical protein OEZ06_00545 [Myxococcales bacterium]|nr:hypothetical protein [Myxococcales bacterium]
MNNIQEQHPTKEHAEAAASRVKNYTEEVASRFEGAVDSASTSVGRGVDRAGQAIESTGKSAGASVRGAGRYLQESSGATLGGDFRSMLGRHPGTTLAVGIAAGLLMGRMLRSNRS